MNPDSDSRLEANALDQLLKMLRMMDNAIEFVEDSGDPGAAGTTVYLVRALAYARKARGLTEQRIGVHFDNLSSISLVDGLKQLRAELEELVAQKFSSVANTKEEMRKIVELVEDALSNLYDARLRDWAAKHPDLIAGAGDALMTPPADLQSKLLLYMLPDSAYADVLEQEYAVGKEAADRGRPWLNKMSPFFFQHARTLELKIADGRLPPELYSFAELTSLKIIARPYPVQFPLGLDRLLSSSSLKTLSITNAVINDTTFGPLSQLLALDLTDVGIVGAPYSLLSLPAGLKSLAIRGNTDLYERIYWSGLADLRSLTISDTPMTEVDDDIYKMSSLEELTLTNNKISCFGSTYMCTNVAIPSAKVNWPNMRRIDISGNEIDTSRVDLSWLRRLPSRPSITIGNQRLSELPILSLGNRGSAPVFNLPPIFSSSFASAAAYGGDDDDDLPLREPVRRY